jgi:hypothetical protein
MFNEVIVVAFATYLLMLVAYRFHEIRLFHVPVMISIMLFDLSMPFYLYLNRDWKTRLIEQGDIFSFMVWTHFGLLIALFVLYGLQVLAGRKLLSNDNSAGAEHQAVAKGILLTRALVIISGALLVQPEA